MDAFAVLALLFLGQTFAHLFVLVNFEITQGAIFR